MLKPDTSLSPEQYLAQEEKSRDKNEYWFGETYMMAGTTRSHNIIVGNVYMSLRQKLADKLCAVYQSDVRLRSSKEEVYVYPDVMVICGKIEADPRQPDTVLNPQLIVEVWWDSTQDYDSGVKFKMYRKIPSLREYVMIDQTTPYIEHYRRDGHFWVLETLEGIEAVLQLRSLACKIDLAEIYRQVEWAESKSKPKSRKRKKA